MPRQQRIEAARDFPVSRERLFAHLSEHENLGALFAPATVERLRDGQGVRNGVGSARSVRPWPFLAFVETVTAYRENELIEYRITRGGLLRHHLGVMRFTTPQPGCSRLEFSIVFEGRFPFIGPIFRAILDRGINQGLAELAL
jgi:hypothetical protein